MKCGEEDAPDPSRVCSRANSLIRSYIRNPEAPSHEEVQHLAQDIEAARMSLEGENKRLRKTVQSLEGYRDRYVDLYDFAPLAYVSLDDGGYIQEMNLTGAALLGAARNDLTGYEFSRHVAPEHLPAFREHLRRCVEGQEGCTTELTLTVRDGRRVPVQLYSLPVRAWDGSIFIKTAITDLTQRREMEESLRQSREFLQTVIDTIPDAVVVVGCNYRLVLANRAAREMAGGEDPAKCTTCFRFLHQQTVPCGGEAETTCAFQRVLSDKTPVTVVQERSAANGERTFYEVTAVPVCDPAGKIVQIIEIWRDASQWRRAEAELREMNDTLERRVAERTAVSRRRALQLRALTAELARAEQRERRHFAEILRDQVQAMLAAAKAKVDGLRTSPRGEGIRAELAEIERLLAKPLAEVQALAVELSPPPLYEEGLAAALRWVAEHMKVKYGLAVKVESDPRAEPIDEGTRVFLFEAVRELLLNVVHHARTERAWVSAAATDDGRLRLEIRDQGAGFDPADMESREEIQDRFGLLAIRERLELLGGRFQIESRAGQGTRVVLLCPLGPPQEDRPGSANASPATGLRGVNGRRVTRVILADDHPTLRRGLADVLSEQPGIEIVGEAADGEHAVEIAVEMRPDVVLMDVMMPRLSGVEATRRILAHLPQTRVIALSGLEEKDAEEAMHAAGAVAFLSKASSVETLVDAIHSKSTW